MFLSPDGEWVGFFGGGKLKKTRITGGAAITMADAVEGVVPLGRRRHHRLRPFARLSTVAGASVGRGTAAGDALVER